MLVLPVQSAAGRRIVVAASVRSWYVANGYHRWRANCEGIQQGDCETALQVFYNLITTTVCRLRLRWSYVAWSCASFYPFAAT